MNLPLIPAGAGERRLTAAQFQHLAEVPAAVEWFASIDNPRTRRAYQGDLADFCSFVGLTAADEFRAVTRSHVLAWRAQLEQRGLAGATIRRKLAALASLFDHLLECNAVASGNPMHEVKRPKINSHEGKTPALGDHQAKALLEAPDATTLKGLRDRAILAVLLYHGKGGKLRYVPLHPVEAKRTHAYLDDSGHHLAQTRAPLFKPLRGRQTGTGISANGLYALVGHYAQVAGIEVIGLGVHGLRATACNGGD